MKLDLRVLLVDDEINIVRNLQKVIPWNQIGFSHVDTASNGVAAFQYVMENETDLILCDIRMPKMDGVTLLKKLREFGKECQVIMLTGYQDFDYVRTALKYGARDYMLKPINYEELQAVIAKLAVEIEEKKLEKMQEQKKWSKARNLAYEKFLFDVLSDYTSVSTRQFLFDDENKLDELEYTLLLVDMDGYSLISRDWNEDERKLRNFAIRNVLMDALSSYPFVYATLQTREGEWCVVIQHQKSASVYNAEQVHVWSKILQQAVLDHVKLSVSIGIYPSNVSITQLAEAYKQLQRAMHLSPQKHQILRLAEESEPNQLNYSMWGMIEEIVSSVKVRDREKMEHAFQELNRTLKVISDQSLLRAEQILHFLILHLLREMRELHVLDEEEERKIWEMLDRSISVKNLLDIIHQLIHNSIHAGMNRKPSELLMLSAKDYIDKNLSADFGVDEISAYLGISGSYFSMLFKQHFGETFLEYLTRQRMELAKSLLVMSDKSIAQISKMTGYIERRYFTRVFYKYTNMTPTEYRDKYSESFATQQPSLLHKQEKGRM